jgi:hypothetical protein
MSAFAWLHNGEKIISLDALCRCGHLAKMHLHGKSCGAELDNFKFCKCEQFREATSSQIQTGDETMAKKDNTRLVVRYEPTAKEGKELLAKDNTSQAAVMYRALASAKGPLTVKETYAACEGKCESGAAYERLSKNLNSTLFALRKAGYVKKQERREELAAKPRSAKANGAPKAKRVRKPKLPAPVHGASAAESSADAAQ